MTLDDKPLDFQKGDLVVVTRSRHGAVPMIFYGISESGKTYQVIGLDYNVEDCLKNKLKPYSSISADYTNQSFNSYWVAKILPYHPDFLGVKQKEQYLEIRKLLNVE